MDTTLPNIFGFNKIILFNRSSRSFILQDRHGSTIQILSISVSKYPPARYTSKYPFPEVEHNRYTKNTDFSAAANEETEMLA